MEFDTLEEASDYFYDNGLNVTYGHGVKWRINVYSKFNLMVLVDGEYIIYNKETSL